METIVDIYRVLDALNVEKVTAHYDNAHGKWWLYVVTSLSKYCIAYASSLEELKVYCDLNGLEFETLIAST